MFGGEGARNLSAPVVALDVAASIRPSVTPCMKFQGCGNQVVNESTNQLNFYLSLYMYRDIIPLSSKFVLSATKMALPPFSAQRSQNKGYVKCQKQPKYGSQSGPLPFVCM